MTPDAHYDVLVVGGGLAGLAAAASAAEAGARAVVMEQGTEPLYACNSRYAGGMMHLAFLDMGLPPEELSQRLLTKRPHDIDPALLALIACNSRETLDWLETRAGARFIRAGAEPWQKWCLAPIRPRRSGLVWTGRGPDKVLRGLETYLRMLGGGVLRGCRVLSIDPDGVGRYRVELLRDGVTQQCTADTVILADGGFQNNRSLMAEMIAPHPDQTLARNAGTAGGFAMQTARRLGLKTTTTHRFYGHIVSSGAQSDARLWPWPTLDELAVAGMLVDRSGLDIGTGLTSGVDMANAIAAQPAGNPCFVIVDDTIWREIGTKTRVVPCNPFLETLAAPMVVADDLEAAARKAGIEWDTLAQQLSARGIAGSRRHTLDRPPFRIIPAIAGITYTMGGLEIQADCHVLDNRGHPMAGLFAAGAATGGLEGGGKTFYLGGLAKAAILGRLAGRSAASHVATNAAGNTLAR